VRHPDLSRLTPQRGQWDHQLLVILDSLYHRRDQWGLVHRDIPDVPAVTVPPRPVMMAPDKARPRLVRPAHIPEREVIEKCSPS